MDLKVAIDLQAPFELLGDLVLVVESPRDRRVLSVMSHEAIGLTHAVGPVHDIDMVRISYRVELL